MSGLSDEDCDEALAFLTGSCDEIASRKAELERTDILRKRVRRKWFLTFDGSNDVRNAKAEQEREVIEADDRYVEAVGAYESLRARRDLMNIKVEVYRTQESTRRQGRI